jgi:DNA-binding IclR family transcriptional regulator
VHRILQALCKQGLVEHDTALRRYMIGATAFELGLVARKPFWALHRFRPTLARLAAHSDDTVYLMGMNGYDIVCLERIDGAFPVRAHTYDVGTRSPMGAGASSIAFLSMLDDSEVDEILSFNAKSLKDYGFQTLAPIRSAIEQCRHTGLAATDGTAEQGVIAISRLVPAVNGVSYLAVSIAAIASRMVPERIRELQPVLDRTVNEIADLCRSPGDPAVSS